MKMYKSPVEVYVNDILNQIHQQEENQIVAEVSQAVGINVEKEELIKALNYDRNQYSKGYKDAVKDVLDKIGAEIKQLADKQFQIAMGVSDLNEIYAHIQMENAYRHSLNIIDKYKEESEGEE